MASQAGAADALAEAARRPRWAYGQVLLARSHASAGRLRRAAQMYARAAELDPSLQPALSEEVAALELQLGQRYCRAVLGRRGGPAVYAAAVAGETLATAGGDGDVQLWALAAGELLQTLEGHLQATTTLAWSPCGAFLASGSLDATARVWRRQAGAPHDAIMAPHATLAGHAGRVSAAAFSPDGATLATASPDGSLRLWDVAAGTCRQDLAAHGGLVTSLSFSPCGAALASASGDASFRLWDPQSGAAVQHVEFESGPVALCGFLPACGRAGGGLLMTAHAQLARGEGRVLLWDALHKKIGWVDGRMVGPAKAIDGLRGRPAGWDACAGADGALLLALVFAGGQGRVWDVGGPADAPPEPLFSFDLNSGGGGGGGREEPAWHNAAAAAASAAPALAAFSPCGELLAACGGPTPRVVVFEAESGRVVRVLAGHGGAVRALRWVGAREVLSASEDGTARVWRVAFDEQGRVE
jgi:WD40 repeat protein